MIVCLVEFCLQNWPVGRAEAAYGEKRYTAHRDRAHLQLAAPSDPNGFGQDAATPPIRIFLLTGAWQPLNALTGNGLCLPNLMQIC